MEPPHPPERPTPPLHSKDHRLKPVWRILLISNLVLGAYLFAQVRMKKPRNEETKSSKRRSKATKEADEVSPEPATPPKAVDASPDPAAPKPVDVASTPTTIPPIPEAIPIPLPPPTIPKPVKVPDPVPEDQQRELFKWLLEEKRKIKPKSPEEKKRIDEEKAILKQFIRSEHIPRI